MLNPELQFCQQVKNDPCILHFATHIATPLRVPEVGLKQIQEKKPLYFDAFIEY